MELRAKMTPLLGKGGREFREKHNNFRLDFRGVIAFMVVMKDR